MVLVTMLGTLFHHLHVMVLGVSLRLELLHLHLQLEHLPLVRQFHLLGLIGQLLQQLSDVLQYDHNRHLPIHLFHGLPSYPYHEHGLTFCHILHALNHDDVCLFHLLLLLRGLHNYLCFLCYELVYHGLKGND